jgi:hypothetical protein
MRTPTKKMRTHILGKNKIQCPLAKNERFLFFKPPLLLKRTSLFLENSRFGITGEDRESLVVFSY